MRRPITLATVCGAMLISLAAPAMAEPAAKPAPALKCVAISIYPAEANLGGSRAQQVLLVTARYANGVERDVTSRARFQVAPPGIVEVSPSGVAVPLRQGAARVKAVFEGKTSVAEFSVSDLEAHRPVGYLQQIAPILTQKGCTGSNCHGSVRGQNGFKLSLFGARPDLDFKEIVEGDEGRRINREQPEESLLLQKPTFQAAHGGGVRFEPGSWEYKTILEWISHGLPYDSGAPALEEIRVYPKERILVGESATQGLVVEGLFKDGRWGDLTRQVRYTSNDETVAVVDDTGEVTAKRPGETSIMIRTQGRVAVAKIAIISMPPASSYPELQAANFIDDIVFAKLRKLNIVPSRVASDSVFLRRVYLDTLGILPTVEETRRFLDSKDPQKRSRLIEELLAREEFVDFWSLKFADVFQAGYHSGVKGGWQLYRWIHRSLAANRPYDEMIRDMLLGGGPFVYDTTVNYFGALWVGPEGVVTKLSQSLLGIRMDCAQCHDHPFERWTQDDFYGMAGFFARLQFKAESYGLFERSIAIRPDGKPTYDYVNNNQELMHPRTKEPVRPRFLTGETVELPPGEDPREALADWLASPENPWFSRAIANRIWKHFMGRGLVEPVDDFRVTNPPSNQALLDALAEHLIGAKYDLQALMKVILNSRTYQSTSIPNETNISDDINYSRFYLKRQIAEVLFDAMCQAAEAQLKIPGYPPGTKAVEVAVGSPNYFLMTFGRTTFRDQIAERNHTPDISQAMNLINGETVNDLVNSAGNIIDRVLEKTDWTDERRVEEIYLAALSRPPSAGEWSEFQARLASADKTKRKQKYHDLLWTILNSKEFAFIY